jgi:ABC-2 type transport system ATP-binding protein
MWDVIRTIVREGTTLLLTTQYLEEADELADTIAVVDHGKIIARGTADQLKAESVARESRSSFIRGMTSVEHARCWLGTSTASARSTSTPVSPAAAD